MPDFKLIFDTSVMIQFIRTPADVVGRLTADVVIYVLVVVLGELRLGARRAKDPGHENGLIDDLLSQATILDCTATTAERFADISYDLGRKGTPIPQNNVWIAASALEHELALFTNDRHFAYVSGLCLGQL